MGEVKGDVGISGQSQRESAGMVVELISCGRWGLAWLIRDPVGWLQLAFKIGVNKIRHIKTGR